MIKRTIENDGKNSIPIGEKKERNFWKAMNKPIDWKTTTIIIFFLMGFFAVLLALIITPVSLGGGCEVRGINYVNVCPNTCWNSEINCYWCPLPTDISCDLQAKAPMIKIIEMFR